MTSAEFTDFLIAEIQAADGATDFVEDILTAAKAKIANSGGQIAPFRTGSVGGKNFERDIRLDAAQVAASCRAALDFAAVNSDGVAGTNYDFSEIGGWN